MRASGNSRRRGAWLSTLVFGLGLLGIPLVAVAQHPIREIGIEGRVEIELGRGDYLPRPLDDRTPLILRIEKVTPAAKGKFLYDFHFMGLEPGSYSLRDYLARPDGAEVEENARVELQARSVLPPDHDGSLTAHLPRAFPALGGYRRLLVLLASIWVAGLFAFYWSGRRKKSKPVEEPVLPPPTYAERMRPLVEAAAAGQLNAAGQAELERLMTGFWREKLALPEQRMADALSSLKAHPEAGALLRALEHWLHRPGGADSSRITGLLAPYGSPASAAPEVRA